MMDVFTDRLYQAMERQLSEAALNMEPLVTQYRKSILICKKAMSKLKNYVSSYAFVDQEEEIRFFRQVKPRFYAKYIYFINIYNFLMQKPAGAEETYRNYIQFYLADLERFFETNKAFYQYYRSGNKQMDSVYFTRGGFHVQVELEDFEEDEQYSTSHDYKLSKIIANEQFLEFLKKEVTKLHEVEKGQAGDEKNFPFKHPTWTAGQVDAVELIYALKVSGSVNNGNIDIAELTAIFEFLFQFEIKDIYHTFTDITNRKKETSVFLRRLSETLLRHINDRLGLGT